MSRYNYWVLDPCRPVSPLGTWSPPTLLGAGLASIFRAALHEACLDLLEAPNSLHKSHVQFSYTTVWVAQILVSILP